MDTETKKSRWFEDEEFRQKRKDSTHKYYLAKGKQMKREKYLLKTEGGKVKKATEFLTSRGYEVSCPVSV